MDNRKPDTDVEREAPPDDLEENPGIGQSKGLFARAGSEDADLLAGENTVEGDVENDSAVGQGIDRRVGRTND